MFEQEVKAPIQRIEDVFPGKNGAELYMLREDQLDPEIPGNKWRKLKYNIAEARRQGHRQLLTFGGAYSNHVAAVAAAGKRYGMATVAVIRGEEHELLNETLSKAKDQGMQLYFIDRERYRRKDDPALLDHLKNTFGPFYLLPEGGSNTAAVKGCAEILDERTRDFDVICCPVGTGGTLAGLAVSRRRQQRLIGFPALRGGEFLRRDIDKLIQAYSGEGEEQRTDNFLYELNTAYHFGGYAKLTGELIEFIRTFYERTGVALDYIYTAKMVYGVYQEICKGNLQNRVLLIHTGGLQGNAGMAKRYKFQSVC